MTQNRETAASIQKTNKASGWNIKVKASMKSNIEN
jgi:hypothetical protein